MPLPMSDVWYTPVDANQPVVRDDKPTTVVIGPLETGLPDIMDKVGHCHAAEDQEATEHGTHPQRSGIS